MTIAFAFLVYVALRNNDVYKFMCRLNRLCYEYSIREGKDGYALFMDKMPSYSKMVMSFKRLRLESYFTDAEIKELLGIKSFKII